MYKCTNLKLIYFADDSTGYMYDNDLNCLSNYVNSELIKIDKWVCSNKLSLNASKTSYSLFSNQKLSHIPEIFIRGTKISKSSCQKFLGVQLDDKLNFRNHINSISLKVNRSVGILWKLSKIEKIIINIISKYNPPSRSCLCINQNLFKAIL